jgi:hypothetical protein
VPRAGGKPLDAALGFRQAVERHAKDEHMQALQHLDVAGRLDPKNAFAFSCE